MEHRVSDEQLLRFSDFIAEMMGLDFPPSRWSDLRCGIASVARALEFKDEAECARWLMSTPLSKHEFEVLADNLTVGETYFFRDQRAFEILANDILPSLIGARRSGEKRLRIWSAACCTGEEPYSLAILLRRMIPDLQDWNVTILGTDINARFLRKAETGVFGHWSFRDAPEWLLKQYFQAAAGCQFEIIPEIRRMVQFTPLNLAEGVYPSLANGTHAMDVIFCRNVLMYFTARQANKVLHNLHRAQVNGGWLIVSPSELMQVSSTPYVTINFPGATLYQKDNAKAQSKIHQSPARQIAWFAVDQPHTDTVVEMPLPPAVVPAEMPVAPIPPSAPQIIEPPQDPFLTAWAHYEQGRYSEAISHLEQLSDARPQDSSVLGLLTRCLANQGKLAEALIVCDQWIVADKLNPAVRYLQAGILQERGEFEEAILALRRALYLDPKFAMAHFALGNIARLRGQSLNADRHFKNALRLVRGYGPDFILPESEQITAARFAEIITDLLSVEPAL